MIIISNETHRRLRQESEKRNNPVTMIYWQDSMNYYIVWDHIKGEVRYVDKPTNG